VYSGGGIEPDKYVPGTIEGFNPTPFSRALAGRLSSRLSRRSSSRRVTLAFHVNPARAGLSSSRTSPVDDQMLKDFREQLTANRLKIDEAAFQKDLTFIRAMIRFGSTRRPSASLKRVDGWWKSTRRPGCTGLLRRSREAGRGGATRARTGGIEN
jgi:hypothetical protein